MLRRIVAVWGTTIVVALGVALGPMRPSVQALTTPPAIALVSLNLPLQSPVGIAHAGDGSGRLFIVLKGGRIVVYDGTRILSTPFLDIAHRVSRGYEQGLLGLAFHPNYETNGLFYVHFTDTDGNTVIERYRVSADPNVADPLSVAEILRVEQPYTNHNGGDLHFGPDGYLYIALGDGGAGGDPENRAQDLGTVLGKILRIDVDATSPGRAYAIPPANPFVNVAGARPEIWHYGLRNPWRFSFDRLTGAMFVGDVGQGRREEIDYAPPGVGGLNFGWRRMEGTRCYNPSSECYDGSLTLPVAEYETHVNGTCAVTGGYRYRGGQSPALVGVYLYGDHCSGQLWTLTETDRVWTAERSIDTSLSIAAFGEDEQGEIYIADLNGQLYRVVGPAPDLTATSSITLTPSETPTPTLSPTPSMTPTASATPAPTTTPGPLIYHAFLPLVRR